MNGGVGRQAWRWSIQEWRQATVDNVAVFYWRGLFGGGTCRLVPPVCGASMMVASCSRRALAGRSTGVRSTWWRCPSVFDPSAEWSTCAGRFGCLHSWSSGRPVFLRVTTFARVGGRCIRIWKGSASVSAVGVARASSPGLRCGTDLGDLLGRREVADDVTSARRQFNKKCLYNNTQCMNIFVDRYSYVNSAAWVKPAEVVTFYAGCIRLQSFWHF